ncbi:unnamed protein product [Echinostoma caproni]|uniref:Uncharacterized protein n=1 Tax=Echinostoma caproni TaxID=27848 RepID=A0A3P8JV59_9TREM|nr:unnamed protein product [Echinostoma caproni]
MIPNSQTPAKLRGLVRPYTPFDRMFLRVVIMLRAATFHVVLKDANSLPPPFRLENASLVGLSYHQEINSSDKDSVPMRSRRSSSVVSGQQNRVPLSDTADHERSPLRFTPSPVPSPDRQYLSELHKRDNFSEPDLVTWNNGAISSYLGPETTGGLSATYNLDRVGFGKTLIYDNFIYLTVFGPLADGWAACARHDSLSCDLVFDVVPGSQRVIYSSKV